MAEEKTTDNVETNPNQNASDAAETISPQQILDMMSAIQESLKDINGGLEKLRELQTDNSKPDVPEPEKDEEPKKEDDDSKKEKDSDNDGKSDLDEIADALDL